MHTFLNAHFKVRQLTLLRLYPACFHKTKCITYANMSTFHKHTTYLNPVCSLQIYKANLSVNSSNISIAKITFASNICKYCMQNMNTLYVYE